METETEKNYQLFKALNTKVVFPKVNAEPETAEQKEKREFLNFLFDKFLQNTEIGKIPTEYNRTDVYIDFVQFVESKSETIANNQKYIEVATPETLINYLTDANWNVFLKSYQKAFEFKHKLPTIDRTKFDAKWIFDTYINVVFKCSEECFNAWLKDGIQHPETIEFILKGKINSKTKLPTLQYAQLQKFIETITGDAENTKDAYYKTVFGLKIKTAQLRTSTKLNDTFKELNKKIFELKHKK